MGSGEMLYRLKVNLFELTSMFETNKRKEIMDQLSFSLKDVTQASKIVFAIYNKWEFTERVSYYSSEYPIVHFKDNLEESFTDYYKTLSDVTLLPSDHIVTNKKNHNIAYLLKMYAENTHYGLLYMTFEPGNEVSKEDLEEIRLQVENFLKLLIHHRHNRYITERDAYLFSLSSKLHSVHSTTEVLEEVMHIVTKFFPSFEYSFLMSKDYENSSLPIEEFDFMDELAAGTVAYINNTLEIEQVEVENETHVYTPLSGRQGVYGVLQIRIPGLPRITEAEIDFINKFSVMFGSALERTTLYQSSNQRVSDLEIINAASQELNTNIDNASIISIAKRYIDESSQPEEFGIINYSDEYNAFTILPESSAYFSSLNGRRFVEYIYERNQADPSPIFYGEFIEDEINIPFKSIIAIPLMDGDQPLGAIILLHHNPYYFSFDKFKFLKAFVQHVSLALGNSILKERLNQLVITDYLTELYSRNFLDEMIVKHMEKEETGTFILFDIDDFKGVNDTYGHYVGDRVLIQVAKIIREETTFNDIASRWGRRIRGLFTR